MGKTEFQFNSQRRPEGLHGSYWKVKTIIPDYKGEYKKSFQIETGSGGALFVYVSTKTSLIYAIQYTVLHWMKFEELRKYLEESIGVEFDNYGNSSIYLDKKRRGYFKVRLTTATEHNLPFVVIIAVNKEGESLYLN